MARWHGRCPGCGEWDTLVEEARREPAVRGGRGGLGASRSRAGRAVAPVALRDVCAPDVPRLKTGIGELDRVLGGGLVPGSLVLLGGSPGIGKPTITASASPTCAALCGRVWPLGHPARPVRRDPHARAGSLIPCVLPLTEPGGW